MSELLKPIDVARLAGVSYPTLKQWISRNPVRGPSYRNLDLALIKRIFFSESTHVDLRVEAFNLTNTPPLGAPNTVVGSPGFGSITSAGDPRVIQLGIKFSF